jgi:hypothetical protein
MEGRNNMNCATAHTDVQGPISALQTIDGLYVIAPECDHRELYERACTLLQRLQAQLLMTCGSGQEHFERLSEESRDAYLAGCTSQAAECLDLLRALGSFVYRGH